MNDPNNTNSSDTLDEADEELLTPTVSDDALEAAAVSPPHTADCGSVNIPATYPCAPPCRPL
jgi:hypothetical protein